MHRSTVPRKNNVKCSDDNFEHRNLHKFNEVNFLHIRRLQIPPISRYRRYHGSQHQ
jgi:hypothetical protein